MGQDNLITEGLNIGVDRGLGKKPMKVFITNPTRDNSPIRGRKKVVSTTSPTKSVCVD